MEKINNPAYKFYIKINGAERINVDYYYGSFTGNMNMNSINYYPYENFNGLTLQEISSVLEVGSITIIGVIDVTKVTDTRINVLPVWCKEIALNDNEQSINEKIASMTEDNKVYNCFVERYCSHLEKPKVYKKSN